MHPRQEFNQSGYLELKVTRSLQIALCYEETKKAIANLSKGVTNRPDRLQVHVYKYGENFVIEAIMDITQSSINSGDILEILRL